MDASQLRCLKELRDRLDQCRLDSIEISEGQQLLNGQMGALLRDFDTMLGRAESHLEKSEMPKVTIEALRGCFDRGEKVRVHYVSGSGVVVSEPQMIAGCMAVEVVPDDGDVSYLFPTAIRGHSFYLACRNIDSAERVGIDPKTVKVGDTVTIAPRDVFDSAAPRTWTWEQYHALDAGMVYGPQDIWVITRVVPAAPEQEQVVAFLCVKDIGERERGAIVAVRYRSAAWDSAYWRPLYLRDVVMVTRLGLATCLPSDFESAINRGGTPIFKQSVIDRLLAETEEKPPEKHWYTKSPLPGVPVGTRLRISNGKAWSDAESDIAPCCVAYEHVLKDWPCFFEFR